MKCLKNCMKQHHTKMTAYNKMRPFSKQKRPNFVSLRGRSAAVAIFKPKVWHPVTKHGSTKQEGSPITKTWIHCFILLPLSSFQGSVSFRATIVRSGMANRFVKDCRVGRTRPPRNDKFGGFCRKTEQFPERNDWKTVQSDTA